MVLHSAFAAILQRGGKVVRMNEASDRATKIKQDILVKSVLVLAPVPVGCSFYEQGVAETDAHPVFIVNDVVKTKK